MGRPDTLSTSTLFPGERTCARLFFGVVFISQGLDAISREVTTFNRIRLSHTSAIIMGGFLIVGGVLFILASTCQIIIGNGIWPWGVLMGGMVVMGLGILVSTVIQGAISLADSIHEYNKRRNPKD